MAQDIYGKEVIKSLEEDAHGLLMDATFVGYPGNWKFFKWGAGNMIGFEAFDRKNVDLAFDLGYASARIPLSPPDFDFDSNVFQLVNDRTKPLAGGGEVRTVDATATNIASFSIAFEPNQNDFSEAQYGEDFENVVKMSAQYGHVAFIIRGHADTFKVLQDLIDAGQKKGVLKALPGPTKSRRYLLNGQALDLASIPAVMEAIKGGAFEGVDGCDPKQTLIEIEKLAIARAEAVKKAVVDFAKRKGMLLDASYLKAEGVGIREPIFAKPMSNDEMAANRRVEFKMVPVVSEAASGGKFDY
jgi:outer membrane protein OmpA-like peptidoglycan-associated protein